MKETKQKRENKSSANNLLVNATLLIAFFTGVLYAAGSAYYTGSLYPWGLDPHQFPLSFHETCYMGLIALFNWSVSWFPGLMLAVSSLSFAVIIFILFVPWGKPKKWIINNVKLSDEQVILFEKTGSFHNFTAMMFLSFLVFGLTLYWCEILGKERTVKSFKDISSGEVALFTTTRNKAENTNVEYSEFYIIEYNPSECAVYWKDENEVEIVARSNVEGSYRKVSI